MSTIPANLTMALRHAQSIVFFTGAGMSADSGIPTFRDQGTGFWERFRAEDLATRDAFQRQPGVVWSWYEWRRMLVERAQPNPEHLAIAQLAAMRPGIRVVTQNVDDLHERSCCLDVVHLHGSLHAPRCLACARPYRAPLSDDFAAAESGQMMPPTCSHCGGKVRPGVVWFGEPLPQAAWDVAADLVCEADMVFVVGTSAQVQPAARLPGLARRAGAKLVQVNPMHTELDNACDWNLRGGAAADLPRLVAALP